MILAGDVGGTNSRIAYFAGDLRQSMCEETDASQAHLRLEEIVAAFVSWERVVSAAIRGGAQ